MVKVSEPLKSLEARINSLNEKELKKWLKQLKPLKHTLKQL
jgi:hypothetical protein